jgi:hypothetical protein
MLVAFFIQDAASSLGVSPSAHSLRKDEQTTVLLDGALASTPKQIECNATYFSQGYPYVVLGVKCWALCMIVFATYTVVQYRRQLRTSELGARTSSVSKNTMYLEI